MCKCGHEISEHKPNKENGKSTLWCMAKINHHLTYDDCADYEEDFESMVKDARAS